MEAVMKRDMNLVRSILLSIEATPVNGNVPLDFPGYDEDTVHYHLKIMVDGGLIEGLDISDPFSQRVMPMGITWAGHDFIDNARSETVWKKALEIAKSNGGLASIEIMKVAVAQAAKIVLTSGL